MINSNRATIFPKIHSDLRNQLLMEREVGMWRIIYNRSSQKGEMTVEISTCHPLYDKKIVFLNFIRDLRQDQVKAIE